MDHALRMDQDVDAFAGQAEQPMCLDHSEAFAHHRCRIDENLAAHEAVRVLAGFLRRHVDKRRRIPRAEQAALLRSR